MSPFGRVVEVALSVTAWRCSAVLAAKTSLAVVVALSRDGAKRTSTVQELPGATVLAVQASSATMKSPAGPSTALTPLSVSSSGSSPVLETVTGCAAPIVLAYWSGKVGWAIQAFAPGAVEGCTAIVFVVVIGAMSSPSLIESAATVTSTLPSARAVSSPVAGSRIATLSASRAASTASSPEPIASCSLPLQRSESG